MPKARNIRDICIVSQNARWLKNEDQIQELSTTIKTKGNFAVCIQETWRSGVENFDHNGNHFIFNGLDKNLNTSCRGEQGIAMWIIEPPTLKQTPL